MKHISDEIQWSEAIPIVNKAINEHTNNRLAKCRNITDNKEKVKVAKRIIKENIKIKLAFNRMLIGWGVITMLILCKIMGTIALIHSIITFAFFAYYRVPTELFIVFLLTVEFAIGILMFIRVKQIRYERNYHDII